MSCNHTWVMYSPLIGEAFECCSKCPMKKSEHKEDGSFWAVNCNDYTLSGPAKSFPFANLVQAGQLDGLNGFPMIYSAPIGRSPSFTAGGAQPKVVRFELSQPIVNDGARITEDVSRNNYSLCVADWLPIKEPMQAIPPTLFCGVDRSLDPVRLAGIRHVGDVSKSIEENLINGLTHTAREGVDPRTIFMSAAKYNALKTALGSQIKLNIQHSPTIDYECIEFMSHYGKAYIMQDDSIHNGAVYMLDMKTWFKHPTWGSVWTNAPGHNLVMSFQ